MALAVVLAVAAVTLLIVGVATRQSGPPQPVPVRASGSTAMPSATAPNPTSDVLTGPVMSDSPPVRVQIPSLEVDSRLERLTLAADNTMTVPKDPDLAGWFVRSATPGSLGPAVIAGHVTWNGSEAVFFELGQLRSGQQVKVTRRDGSAATFAVTKVQQYAKRRFPTEAVYGRVDHAALRLITCGGTYDRERNRYADNVVVYARLVRSST